MYQVLGRIEFLCHKPVGSSDAGLIVGKTDLDEKDGRKVSGCSPAWKC